MLQQFSLLKHAAQTQLIPEISKQNLSALAIKRQKTQNKTHREHSQKPPSCFQGAKDSKPGKTLLRVGGERAGTTRHLVLQLDRKG